MQTHYPFKFLNTSLVTRTAVKIGMCYRYRLTCILYVYPHFAVSHFAVSYFADSGFLRVGLGSGLVLGLGLGLELGLELGFRDRVRVRDKVSVRG